MESEINKEIWYIALCGRWKGLLLILGSGLVYGDALSVVVYTEETIAPMSHIHSNTAVPMSPSPSASERDSLYESDYSLRLRKIHKIAM